MPSNEEKVPTVHYYIVVMVTAWNYCSLGLKGRRRKWLPGSYTVWTEVYLIGSVTFSRGT